MSIHDLDLFSLNVNSITDTDYNTLFGTICCKYYSPSTLTQLISSKEAHQSSLSFFHTNIRSLRGNLENFQSYFEWVKFSFYFLVFTESRINNEKLDFNPSTLNYNFKFVLTPLSAGGVGMYMAHKLQYKVIEQKQ